MGITSGAIIRKTFSNATLEETARVERLEKDRGDKERRYESYHCR
jgi:hypothetical protein